MTLNRSIALLTIRLILGLIVLMQGIGKIFKWGLESMYRDMFQETYQELLPEFILRFTLYYTTFVELIAGILLIIGLKRDYALYALATVYVIVAFGHGLSNPVWNLDHIMYRTMLLASILIMPKEWDTISLDQYFKKR